MGPIDDVGKAMTVYSFRIFFVCLYVCEREKEWKCQIEVLLCEKEERMEGSRNK